MRVLLTAGGTREPIDDVRVVANTSTGRLGARLADAFADAGHDVVLLHGETAALPRTAAVERHAFGPSSKLWTLLESQLPRADVVVHAAAVSDYLPVRSAGKLSSDADELVVRMTRAPKLIDRLRDRAPKAFLVGFKLTSGLDRQERVVVAHALLERAQLDLVVANESARIGEADHEALLISPAGVSDVVGGKVALARAVVAAVRAGAGRVAEAS